MSLGVISLCVCEERDAFDEFGAAFGEFGRGVWNRSLELSLEVILMSLMSLGVISLCFREKGGAFDKFGGAFDEFGRGFGTGGAWRVSLEVILVSL